MQYDNVYQSNPVFLNWCFKEPKGSMDQRQGFREEFGYKLVEILSTDTTGGKLVDFVLNLI